MRCGAPASGLGGGDGIPNFSPEQDADWFK